jgi:hypothetical protein
MKKIVLTAAAALALGVAACTPAANDAGNNVVDTNITENEASVDVNGAAAVDATGNALDSVGDAAANTASDVGNAAASAANTVSNAVD